MCHLFYLKRAIEALSHVEASGTVSSTVDETVCVYPFLALEGAEIGWKLN